MNNSPIIGIIITGKQRCGKTRFLQNFAKSHNSIFYHLENFKSKYQREVQNKEVERLYDFDLIVLDELDTTALKNVEFPITSTFRKSYETESTTFFRPLILAATNIPKKEMGLGSVAKNWIVFDIANDIDWRINLDKLISRFVLDKTL